MDGTQAPAPASPAGEEEVVEEEDLRFQREARTSRLARYFTSDDKTALLQAEKIWDREEDAALFARKAVPLVKLTRAQSAQRRDLVSALGGDTLVEKDAVTQYQIKEASPQFSLETGDNSSWKRKQSVVKEYLLMSQTRSKDFNVLSATRRFPSPLARQSAVCFYSDTRSGRARLNPYADVEAVFSSRERSVEAILYHRSVRADPYKANPYLDQDNATFVANRARQIRIRISQLGLLNTATAGSKGRKSEDRSIETLLRGADAWRKCRPQPTQVKVDEVRNWKLLGETDPRMVISPTARRGHTMVKIDANYALVFGGALGKGFQYSSQLFHFHFQTNQFELVDVTGTRPCGRSFQSAIVSLTKMVIFGGLGKQGTLDDCFEYSIKDQQWGILFQNGAVKPRPRYGHTMTDTVNSGVVLLYGGAGAGFFDDLFSLDTRTGNWEPIRPNGTVPAPRAFHSAIALENNTKMVIFGGQNGSANLNDLHEYHVESNTWTFVRTNGIQPSPRWSHTVVRKGMDSFILFGGAGETFFDEILFYNSYRETWTQFHGLGPGPSPRWGHSAVHSEEMGLLFVFGGCTKDSPTVRDLHELKMDEILAGAPPKKKMLDGVQVKEGNKILSQIHAERSEAWTNTRSGSLTSQRRWSAASKRHTQGNVAVLTQVAPFATQQAILQKSIGMPNIAAIPNQLEPGERIRPQTEKGKGSRF